MWVLDAESKRIVQRNITYVSSWDLGWARPKSGRSERVSACMHMQVPGLYKIFDEIIVNASDNKQRDPTMDTIKVVVDQASASAPFLLTLRCWSVAAPGSCSEPLLLCLLPPGLTDPRRVGRSLFGTTAAVSRSRSTRSTRSTCQS